MNQCTDINFSARRMGLEAGIVTMITMQVLSALIPHAAWVGVPIGLCAGLLIWRGNKRRERYVEALHRRLQCAMIRHGRYSAPEPKVETQPAAEHAAAAAGPQRILVAEDNEINQFLVREIVERAGYACDLVKTGTAAVEAARSGAYSLILMDCQMPEMDGLAATQKIRAEELAAQPPRRIPIVALTGETDRREQDKCLAIGMDGYLTKPIDARRLQAVIRGLIMNPGLLATPETPVQAVATGKDAPPIDEKSLLTRCMNDAQFAANTLAKFAARAASELENIQKAFEQGSAAEVRRLAHTFKSLAGHVSAQSAADTARQIERQADTGSLDGVEAMLVRLNSEVKQCIEFIPGLHASLAGAANQDTVKSLLMERR